MLVLRKEMKVGLGIGAAVAGIALVYGVMATLSNSSKTPGAANPDSSVASNDSSSAPNLSQGGLPPADEVGKTGATGTTSDPYLESARNDGNKSDPWTQALQTGRVADAQPVSHQLINTAGGSNSGGSNGGGAFPLPSGTAGSTAFDNNAGPIVTKAPTELASSGGTSTGGITGDSTTGSTHDTGTLKTSPAAAAGTYKVEPGDSFSKIAAKLFGDKRMADAIQKANPDIAPTRLRAGATINVPAKEEVATIRGEVHKSVTRVTGAIDASKEYRVASGDTLNRIAVKLYGHRAMWEKIYDANKAAIGSDPARLKVGQVLKLPEAPTASASAAH